MARLEQRIAVLSPGSRVVVGAVENGVTDNAQVQRHGVAANERTRRIDHVVDRERPVGGRSGTARVSARTDLPVADELNTNASDVEPVGNHAVRDAENVDTVAVREVSSDN